MKTNQLKEGYIENANVPQFDDTGLTDEWQCAVYMFALALATSHPFRTVIDVGCGSGYKLVNYFPYSDTIGVEANPATLEFLRKTYPGNLWFSNEELDRIIEDGGNSENILCICSDVIEHVADPVEFMEWLLHVPWDQAILSTPDRDLGNEPDGPPGNVHHFREWSFNEFRSFLDQWPDRFSVKLHCVINPEQRTQMAWLERTSSVTPEETESHSDPENGGSTSGSASL